jgi:hypothetical protein
MEDLRRAHPTLPATTVVNAAVTAYLRSAAVDLDRQRRIITEQEARALCGMGDAHRTTWWRYCRTKGITHRRGEYDRDQVVAARGVRL